MLTDSYVGMEAKHASGRVPKFSPSSSVQFGLPVIAEVDHKDVKIGGQIGGGGFAIVYAGKWKGQPVALKTLVGWDCTKLADRRSLVLNGGCMFCSLIREWMKLSRRSS